MTPPVTRATPAVPAQRSDSPRPWAGALPGADPGSGTVSEADPGSGTGSGRSAAAPSPERGILRAPVRRRARRAAAGRPGSTNRTLRRLAGALVALMLMHGVAVGVLLGPRSGWTWGTAPVRSLEADPGPAADDAPSVAGAGAARRVPGGPAPLPAEVVPLPVGLSIPTIGVDEPALIRLGRAGDGTMQVPVDYGEAGWFTGGPPPGAPGPAVIAGHVDSKAGPAVFFRLRELRPGDPVDVRLDDGTTARFAVDGVQQYPKNEFPTDTVFGPVPGSALRLITCGGSFDPVAGSYRDNIVVYASPRGDSG
ncbi:MAG: class F sortase [Pseudonocardia sp.]